MIIIYKDIVRKYINTLTIKDLEKFAIEYKLQYTQDELLIIYNFIKYYYNDLLNNNIKVFENIKNKINPILYKKLLDLYIDYKKRYL